MLRRQVNEKGAFSATTHAHTEELVAAVRQRRAEMDEAWEQLDEGWESLEKGMVSTGMVKPTPSDEGMVRLNVGGSHVNVRRSFLEELRDRYPESWSLGHLFEGVWDRRLPRDADGRIVLDESPTCVRYLVHGMLNSPEVTKASKFLASHMSLSADEEPDLPYVSRVLRLSGPRGKVTGGSTMLGHDGLFPAAFTILNWCPGRCRGLELIYRASPDGLDPAAFHSRCDVNVFPTITLIRVGDRKSNRDSVVGGFSSISWHSIGCYAAAPDAFVFMLKRGSMPGFVPAKWGLRNRQDDCAIFCDPGYLPCFGEGDLMVSHTGQIYTRRNRYRMNKRSPLLCINGQYVKEMEVFRVCHEASTPPPPVGNVAIDDVAKHLLVTPPLSRKRMRTFGRSDCQSPA